MANEHPVHLHLLKSTWRRRDALRAMAASMALAATACTREPKERIHPWVDMPEARAEGSPVFYASAVLREGHAMGVLVTTFGGRPTKVEGNPLHPSSLGATDVFAQASVLDLWDPDRSQAPAQRLAGRKSPPVVSSWAAFETQWVRVANTLSQRGGEGLRVLTGPVTSPTLRAQLDALAQRWPGARLHQYAQAPSNARAGSVAAFGREVQPVYRIDHAACVLSLGADLFGDGPGAVRHAMDWAARRARGEPQAAFAVETTPGLFGARADRRIALPPPAIDALAARLAIGQPVGTFEAEVLRALRQAGPDALVIAGAAASEATHAHVHALNEQLGASGRTVQYMEPLAWSPHAADIASLVDDMQAGRVQALLVLDANPVYDLAGDLGFARALDQVPFTVHCGAMRDETAHACDWHLPLSHTFESWGDARSHDGTATIVQPAIAPLYDTRSLHEVLALIARDDVREAHAIVQRTWRERATGDFEAFWRQALSTGVVKGTAAQPLQVKARTPSAVPRTSEMRQEAASSPASASTHASAAAHTPEARIDNSLVAVFAPDASVADGRFANNAWLQELPRPFTKLTWDNAAFLGPGTAKRLSLKTGDVVRLRAGSRSVTAPVWVQASHAEDAVTLPLGYGRRNAGRVGNGVGFDAYALVRGDGRPQAVTIERTTLTHAFAVTQHTMDPSGREPARSIEPGGRMEADSAQPSLYADWEYPKHAWAMNIDLDACIGCNACTIACQAENNIPTVGKEEVANGREMHWIRVDAYESPELANTIFQPVPCMHCEHAPCEVVCPVGATVHDSEGLNVQVYNRCIGTRFCSNNCPYKVRRFNFLQFSDDTTESLKGQRNPEVTVRNRGVMEKCNYCLQRVTRARQHAERTGVALADGDVVTACQAVCPTQAIRFGDLNDANSAVAKLRQSPRHYALLAELNTRPRTTYLARLRPKVPRKPGGST